MKRARSAWVVIPAALIVALMIVGVSYVLLKPEETPTPVLVASTPVPATTTNDWPQFNGNPWHSGWITAETRLNASNVSGLKKLFQVEISGTVDGAPVYQSNVGMPDGLKNLLIATTTDGTTFALDANTGKILWAQSNPAGNCVRNADKKPCYTTAQPALDPNRLYVYAYGLDGYVHKYVTSSGSELKGSGWPALVSARPDQEKGSSDLSIATARNGESYLYVAHAYYPDGTRRNQGHLTTINLKDGSQHVFNFTCSDQPDVHFGANGADCPTFENGVWARGGPTYSPDTDRIYLQVGCCTFDPAKHQWGHSLLALKPDGTGSAPGVPLDSYTMADWQNLSEATQLASSGPALLPLPSGSKVAHVAAQAGKDARIRLVNLDDLSGQGGPGKTGGELNGKLTDVPGGSSIPMFSQPAVWLDPSTNTPWLYISTVKDLVGYQIITNAAGLPELKQVWQKPLGANSSPVIVNGVLYYARTSDIMALDPLTGEQRWHDTSIGGNHWQSPIVVNGVLYIADQDKKLIAYALP